MPRVASHFSFILGHLGKGPPTICPGSDASQVFLQCAHSTACSLWLLALWAGTTAIKFILWQLGQVRSSRMWHVVGTVSMCNPLAHAAVADPSMGVSRESSSGK